MRLYRLHTENVERAWILDTVSRYFKGFTVYNVSGMYKGVAESSLVIEIMAPGHVANVMVFLAKVIAQHNKQESVYITHSEIRGELVYGH